MIRKIFSKFLYRNGYKNNSPRWAFLEGFNVPDIDDPSQVYLWRLRIVGTPWFSLFLHKINMPDNRPVLHDHPFSFFSVILRGGYVEFVPGPYYAQSRYVNRFNWKPLKKKKNGEWDISGSLHWIAELDRTPTWTLVFVGRRQRVWGYQDRDGTWTPFNKHEFNDKFEEALELHGGGGMM